MNHLKQMGYAVQMVIDTTKKLPTGRNGTKQKSVSWAYYLLPYMEENTVYEAYNKNFDADDPGKRPHDAPCRSKCTPAPAAAAPQPIATSTTTKPRRASSPPLHSATTPRTPG